MVRQNDALSSAWIKTRIGPSMQDNTIIYPDDADIAILFQYTDWILVNTVILYNNEGNKITNRRISMKISDKDGKLPYKEIVIELEEMWSLINKSKSLLGEHVVGAIMQQKIEDAV